MIKAINANKFVKNIAVATMLTAGAIGAGNLNAKSLLLMTDISGILKDKDDPDTLISRIYLDEIPQLEKDNIISGGMIPKVKCCAKALELGVNKVFIIDGRIKHSILIETLTDEGAGTMLLKGK